jgi:hypothetical protein
VLVASATGGVVPRYFFHLRGYIDAEDDEGVELPDAVAARAHAGKYALDEAAATVLEHQRFDADYAILVADEAGEIVFTVKFGEVVEHKLIGTLE